MVGQLSPWSLVGAEQTADGYEVAWKSGTQFTIWNTDSSGHYLSNIGVVSGNSATLESLETGFHQDLNGDGVIGIPAVTIEFFGSTNLDQVGNNYFLNPAAGGIGPELQYAGAAVVVGQLSPWSLVGAEQTAGGYEVAWKSGTQFTIWNTDSSGHYLSNIGVVSGNSATLESLEMSFHQDLNGDGVIGGLSATAPASAIAFSSATENSNNIVTLKGVADANSQIKLYDGTSSQGTVTTAADGTWSFTTPSAVSNTVHTFTAQQVDDTGHVVASSGNAIFGSKGSDTLVSSAGDDLLVGNGNSDTFVFAANFGHDVIRDFSTANDTVQFSKSIFDNFASVLAHASQVSNDVVISSGADSLTLKNTKLGALDSHDFHFA